VTVSVPAKSSRKKGASKPGQPAPAKPAPPPTPWAAPPVEPAADPIPEAVYVEEVPVSGNRDKMIGYGVFGVVALILIALGRCTVTSNEVASAPPEKTAAPEVSYDDPATWQTMYSVGPFNLRSAATINSKLVANLPRGTELVGTIVPGEEDVVANWFLIKKGPHTGRYASTVNLGSAAPPSIDASTAGEYFVVSDVMPLVSPDASSSAISNTKQKFVAGQQVKTNGTIGDYAEVGLKLGGVGYMLSSNLSTTQYGYDAAYQDGEGSSSIKITNRCNSRLEIGVYYYSGGRWQDNDGAIWTWGPYLSSFPLFSGSDSSNRLFADSNQIYIVTFKRDGASNSNGMEGLSRITYGSRDVSATKYDATTAPDGTYEVTIC
jgi:hypothetical protein